MKRALHQHNQKRKGVSEMVSYVLLVVIAIGLSIFVYAYLRGYTPAETTQCPQDVSLVIESAVCGAADQARDGFQGSVLRLGLKNNGFFTVEGAYVRVGKEGKRTRTLINDPTKSLTKDDFYFPGTGGKTGLTPGALYVHDYKMANLPSSDYVLEIQPAITSKETNKLAACENALTTQKITCISSALPAPSQTQPSGGTGGTTGTGGTGTEGTGGTTGGIGTNVPPTVSLTDPKSGSAFGTGRIISLTANAADADGIAKVEFFDGVKPIETATSSPYSVTFTTSITGQHSLTAKATDKKGASTTSSPVTITLSDPPSVSIHSPFNGATFSSGSDITITAGASDSDGSIRKVQFYSNRVKIGDGVRTPSGTLWEFIWRAVPPGSYSLTANATDNSAFGDSAVSTLSSPISIIVNAPSTPSTFTLKIGVFGTGSGSVSTSDKKIASCTASNSPCSASYLAGTVVTIIASPASGSTTFFNGPGSCSGSIIQCQLTMDANKEVSVQFTSSTPAPAPSPSNQAPTVSLTSPANGEAFTAPATISLAASASDTDGSVTKVEFYSSTNLIATDTTASDGWRGTWSNVAAGSYSLTAKAYDNSGASTTSSPVSITVNAPQQITTKTLTVKAINVDEGRGTITSSPTGISCTASGNYASTICTAQFSQGTSVTLIAAATSTSTPFWHICPGILSGTSGAGEAQQCFGISMSTDRTAEAQFYPCSWSGAC